MVKKMMATLTAEHLVVLDMADRFRGTLEVLRDSQDFSGVQDGLWSFSRLMDETVSQHFPQEEDELFPKMIKANPGLNDEVSSLLEEHKAIGQAHLSLRDSIMMENPLPTAIFETGTSLLNSLENHLRREHEAMSGLNK